MDNRQIERKHPIVALSTGLQLSAAVLRRFFWDAPRHGENAAEERFQSVVQRLEPLGIPSVKLPRCPLCGSIEGPFSHSVPVCMDRGACLRRLARSINEILTGDLEPHPSCCLHHSLFKRRGPCWDVLNLLSGALPYRGNR